MLQFILAGVGFVLWALYIIMTYYSTSYSKISHIENAEGYGSYILLMAVLYLGYKAYTLFIQPKKELSIGLPTIVGGTLLHLFIICGFYSYFPEVLQSPFMGSTKPSSLVLFFHILSLLLYPVLLIILTRSVGYTLLNLLPIQWKDEDMRIRFPVETTFGFLIFSTTLLILAWMFGYTLTVLIVSICLMIAMGIPGLLETYHDIRTRKIVYKNHDLNGSFTEMLNLKLLSMEFAVFFLTFIISVSFINILRPMPIGWDDLGVYMNFPKIMATSGEILKGAGFYVWQLITGTGFLFSYTAAQAFYVNQIGGILAVISITGVLSYIFQEKNKTSLLSLPLLLATVFYVMPMTVFQQAKDMKLDPALMFFSVSAFILLFSFWKKHEGKRGFIFIFLAGILTGFAFGVKITTLMLLLGGLGLIAYRYLSLGGYLGFFFLFISIFTEGNLWKKLNVIMPSDPTIINTIVISTGLLGVASIIWGSLEQKKDGIQRLQSWIIASLIFIAGFGISLSPWLVKNFSEAKSLSIDLVLVGSGGTTSYDYGQFHTQEELKEIDERMKSSVTSSGQTQNEDFGRYFGYDKGINNYLKLPANITFQANQSGEFTEITYIFLALVPALLLFVRSRKGVFSIFSGGILLLMILYYFIPTSRDSITAVFDSISLETGFGYGIILMMNLVYLITVHYSFEKTESNDKLKDILMFMGIYGFIFMISAFGIVWYGIMIYFVFFAIIGLSAGTFLDYGEEDTKDDDNMSIRVTLAAILFILIATYFLRSAFPHGWNNLRSAYYNEYKYNILTQDEAIFAYRSDYIAPIATMNLKDPKTLVSGIINLPISDTIKKIFQDNKDIIEVSDIHGIITKLRSQDTAQLKKDAKIIGDYFYSHILYPSDTESNTGGIYRIGTFMTYLIDNNRKRYYDDSLVMGFSNYIYTPSPEETVERMKKMGLKYLLVDLNAATIDKDPRHDLTDRFEKLLLTMRAKNLKLVDTDNRCLELALSEYKSGKLQDETSYIDIAGTNYESYRAGKVVGRNQKLNNCHRYIIDKLSRSESGLGKNLENLRQVILSQGAQNSSEKLSQVLVSYAGQSWFALFEITDLPMTNTTPQTNTAPATISGSTIPQN